MFSYVAKSLLSKTLRTFLRKYLENIELEGINYGSSSSSAEAGGSSGWGVRLSNVKLREGMELVRLPGKRKRVAIRKKRVRRTDVKSSSVDNDNTPRQKNSKGIIDMEVREESVALPPIATNMAENVSAFEEDDLSIVTRVVGDVINGTFETSLLPGNTCRDRSSIFDTDDDGYFSSNPATPNQSRHGLCGVSSPFCRHSKTVYSQKEAPVSSVNTSFGVDQLRIAKPIPNELDGESCTKNTVDNNPDLCPRTPTWQNVVLPPAKDEHESRHFDADKNDDSDDDSFIEVDEEFVIEEELSLCVGAGGAIGTLNIRLVGGELHVTVEGAHLVVEAVPVNESCFDEGHESGKGSHKTNLDLSTPMETDMPTSVDNNKGPKMGEKIQKKSLLARCLSMIPHLFLRDSKLTLLLPAEMGDDEHADDELYAFEVGIEFLSVTSDSENDMDFLGYHTENQSTEGPPTPNKSWGFRQSNSVAEETPSSNSEERIDQVYESNFFARKRIRTGKGPEGGLWLRIHPPLGKVIPPHRVRHPSEPTWARTRFVDSSESFFFRCSGVDLHARMLVDIVEDEMDDAIYEIGNTWCNDEYDDYTMDSMLFGVGYVDPISLTRHQIKHKMRREKISNPLASDDVNRTDKNTIQSIPYASNIHWIAQRAHCSDCTSSHLPLKECFYCWNKCVQQELVAESPMNETMPLPGFIFCLSVSDPLELNVDRSTLEALGYLNSLLTSASEQKNEGVENHHHQKIEDANVNKAHGRKVDEVTDNMSWDFDDKSFPPFMQPDAIYLYSVFVSKLIIRVEAVQPSLCSTLRFRFWEFVGKTIQFEQSQVDAEEHSLRDVTFLIRSMECKDFIGVCERKLVLSGIDASTIVDTHGSEGEVRLPCTASRVLGVFYPTADRPLRSNAVHMRLILSGFPKESASNCGVNYVNIRMGTVDIAIDDTLLIDISMASDEFISIFSSGKSKMIDAEKPKHDSTPHSRWLCQASTVGGTFSYQPIIKMKIPGSNFRVRSGPQGISFESVLHKLGVEYGSYSFERAMKPSIRPLCDLTESLRMHILLYLDELTSLEKVLNIKKKKSSAFLRSHVVSKKLSNLGAALLNEKTRRQTEDSRRDLALRRLQSLDNESLEALLTMHERSLDSLGGPLIEFS